MTATRNIPNWNNSGHVTIPSPPFYVNGGKKKLITPEKTGGTACRGAGSTLDSITQVFTNCKHDILLSSLASILPQPPCGGWGSLLGCC